MCQRPEGREAVTLVRPTERATDNFSGIHDYLDAVLHIIAQVQPTGVFQCSRSCMNTPNVLRRSCGVLLYFLTDDSLCPFFFGVVYMMLAVCCNCLHNSLLPSTVNM